MASRRKAEELIVSGAVRLNGRVVRELGTKIDPTSDTVVVSGKVLQREAPVLYRFHKPRKVVSTLADPEGRTCIADFVSELPERLFPVGRLDYDVSGLLLLTNDGELAERMLHPRFGARRTYWAKVQGKLSGEALHRLVRGVRLKDGRGRALEARTLPASKLRESLLGRRPEKGESDFLELVVTEGRNHFVKRLLEAVGHPVLSLSRVGYGDYRLEKLRPGELRLSRISDRERTHPRKPSS